MAIEVTSTLPVHLRSLLDEAAGHWREGSKLKRLWKKDAALWTGEDESEWLGWLDIVERQRKDLERLKDLQEETRQAGFAAVIFLGMGGAALSAQVLAQVFGPQAGFPSLTVISTTHPEELKKIRAGIDFERTLFIAASQSGRTLETNLLMAYFLAETRMAVGEEAAGGHFIAITGTDSRLEQAARDAKFRRIYFGDARTGGCYATFSDFGLVAAAVLGLDLETMLSEAQQAVDICKLKDLAVNAGVQLGLLLGVAQQSGQDKVTFFFSPEIRSFGTWLEALIAASSGKDGKGLLPVNGEHIAPPSHYSGDRLFVYIHLETTRNKELDHQVEKLERAGHAVIRLTIASIAAIAQQFFLWQFAAAIAGSVTGTNPFDQPDVAAGKAEARLLIDEPGSARTRLREPLYAEGGEHGILLYASRKYGARLRKVAGDKPTVGSLLRAHLDQLAPGNYFATLAYVEKNVENDEILQFFRHQVRGARRVATSLGLGPQGQHALGQLYHGGANTGVFLQVTAEHAVDLPVPGQSSTFGKWMDAQAAGDLAALEQGSRRVLRVHLGKDARAGLKRLSETIEAALNRD